MKPLFWKRLQYTAADLGHHKNVVWSNLHEPELKDMADFEELFAKKGGGVVRKKALSESFGAKPPVSRPVSMLDQKRSQAVGILMRSLHLEMVDIRHAVYQLDCSTVDRESLQALWDNVRMAAGPVSRVRSGNTPLPPLFLSSSSPLPPLFLSSSSPHMQQATQEELEMITAHLNTSPDTALDKPEMYGALSRVFNASMFMLLLPLLPTLHPPRSSTFPPPPSLRFLFELSQIVQFRERVWCFLFQTSFSDGLATLTFKTDNIVKACKVRAQHVKGIVTSLRFLSTTSSLLLLSPLPLSSFSSPPSVTVGVH